MTQEQRVTEEAVRMGRFAGIEVCRQREDMCLLIRFFNGYANSTSLPKLLLPVCQELGDEDCERVAETIAGQGVG